VFIVVRIREECGVTRHTDEAVAVGLGHSGRLVTSAALVLFVCFAAPFCGPQLDLKILAMTATSLTGCAAAAFHGGCCRKPAGAVVAGDASSVRARPPV
jgi:uncharacterized membrane protein YdfJ with MMPL/SSD domain